MHGSQVYSSPTDPYQESSEVTDHGKRGREYFAWLKAEQHRLHAAGVCCIPGCGKACSLNVRTGLPKWRCDDCQSIVNKAHADYMRGRKRHNRGNWKRSAASRQREKDASRRYENERYLRLKAAGFCVRCGVEPVKKNGPEMCRQCRLDRSVALAKRNAKRQKPCVTQDCPNTVHQKSPTGRCRTCAARYAASVANQRHRERKAAA